MQACSGFQGKTALYFNVDKSFCHSILRWTANRNGHTSNESKRVKSYINQSYKMAFTHFWHQCAKTLSNVRQPTKRNIPSNGKASLDILVKNDSAKPAYWMMESTALRKRTSRIINACPAFCQGQKRNRYLH